MLMSFQTISFINYGKMFPRCPSRFAQVSLLVQRIVSGVGRFQRREKFHVNSSG
jgi:hypothetical protein